MKKTTFKRLLGAVLTGAMLLTLGGCSGSSSTAESSAKTAESSNADVNSTADESSKADESSTADEGSKAEESSAADSAAAADDSLQKVKDAGEFVLGLDASFEPMGYTDANDQIVGFDIDLAEEVCKRMGVKLVKQPINWDTKEEDLNGGRIDCIWNGMSVNDSRKQAMNLSDPYMKNSMVFVVPANSTAASMNDLANAKVAVQNGSTAQEILEASAIGKSISEQLLATNVEALLQMDSGLVDAVFLDSVVAEYKIASDKKDWKILPDGLEEEEYAIGFRKADQTLRDAVQKTLGEMKADGTVNTISTKWFGSDVTTIQ